MKKRFAAVFATLSIAALTAAGASEFGRPGMVTPAQPHDEAVDATIDTDAVPIPVSGSISQMFAIAFGDKQSCLKREDVVAQLSKQAKAFGGQVVVLEDGLEQSFADQWRREVHVPTVRVSSVVAHLFGDQEDDDWSADVVEFDGSGCAMSRTMVPGDIWTDILKDAVGVEV
jgi:hypothetical protein